MINTDFGILNGRRYLGQSAQAPAWAVCTAIHHVADQVKHVFVRTTQPILQGHEVRANILCGTRNKTQHLWNTTQHLHLRRTASGCFFFGTAQFFQQRHRPAGGLVHIKLAKPGQFDHLGSRHHADHGIAVVTSSTQVVQNRQEMVFEEQHARDNDIGLCDVGLAACNSSVVAGIFRCGMHRQVETRDLAHE